MTSLIHFARTWAPLLLWCGSVLLFAAIPLGIMTEPVYGEDTNDIIATAMACMALALSVAACALWTWRRYQKTRQHASMYVVDFLGFSLVATFVSLAVGMLLADIAAEVFGGGFYRGIQ